MVASDNLTFSCLQSDCFLVKKDFVLRANKQRQDSRIRYKRAVSQGYRLMPRMAIQSLVERCKKPENACKLYSFRIAAVISAFFRIC